MPPNRQRSLEDREAGVDMFNGPNRDFDEEYRMI
jgi:hypothetical protein